MYSLRKTLVLGTTLATAAVFAIAGILLYLLMRASLVEQFDRALLDKARMFISAVEQERGMVSMEFDDLDMSELQANHPTGYLELWQSDGSVLYRSPGLAGKDLEKPVGQLTTPSWHAIPLPDGQRGRALFLSFIPRSENRGPGSHDDEDSATEKTATAVSVKNRDATVSLVFARNTVWVDEVLSRLRWLLISVGLVSIAVSTSVLWWLIRHGLRPLEKLAYEIKHIDASDLSRLVGQESCPSELRPVIARLNDLLMRLDAAFRRERAFSANVAHELRNPLTALCLKMDIARSKSRESREYEVAIDQCREITTQMQRMVENLLSLARIEAGQIPLHTESMNLDELIRELWVPLEPEAIQRRLEVEWAVSQPLPLVSDASLVGSVLRNILENAVVYTNEGGTVRVEARAADNTIVVSVRNSGSRLTQDQAECAFTQFWRGDEARGDIGIHCGLGLSLVRKIVELLGGTTRVRSQVGDDFEISFTLPL